MRSIHKSKILLYISVKEEYFKQNLTKEQNLQIHFVSSFVELLKAFVNSEFIVVGGGDYIGDYGHFLIRIRGFGKMFILAILTKFFFKKFLMINNGFWVITRNGLALLKVILSLTYCASVRDSRSYDLVSRYTSRKSVKGFDTSMLLDDRCQSSTSIHRRSVRNIGFSITPVFSTSFFKPEKDEVLAKVIARDINIILTSIKDINLYFLAFSTHSKIGDLNIIKKIMRMVDTKHLGRVGLIAYTGTISDFMSKFSQLDVVICCKYHSIIFSYLLEKPMMVIGYHPKNAAVVHDIELSRRAYLSLEDVLNGKIRWRLLDLLSNPEQFRAKLPIYEAKRKALDGILECIHALI